MVLLSSSPKSASKSASSLRGKSFAQRMQVAAADPWYELEDRVSKKLERLNRDTPWYELDERGFSDAMLEMEDATVDFYEEGGGFSGDYGREEDAAIREFWELEWGCVYDWRKREWRHTATGKRFESEGEKQAKLIWVERVEEEERNAHASAAADSVAVSAATATTVTAASANTYNDEWSGLDWVKEYDAYHDYGWYDKGWGPSSAAEEADAAAVTVTPAFGSKEVDVVVENDSNESSPSSSPSLPTVCCQGVLYLEEHTAEPGNPDWRMFIYYDEGKRRYVVKGSRRSVVSSGSGNGRKMKTVYPDVRLAFRYSSDVLDYLAWCMNARPTCDMVMYAMCCDTVTMLSVDELCTMKPYGRKTELYGYDAMRVTRADLREQLHILRGADWKYSSFDDVN